MTFEHGKNTIVKTKEGLLRGFKQDSVYHFLGVKYADSERFMPPTEPESWNGVKEATSYGYICPNIQKNRIGNNVKNLHRFWPESENCQYLNIWTQSIEPGVKKPVIVWFHGGGFFDGSSLEHATYDGFNLCNLYDVVVITLNHRLNVFGYMDLSEYGEKFARSKNVGNLDLVAALKWIHVNINSFGGDAQNVTLFGQSGGGIKVISVMNMPSAKGLFKAGMSMSGLEGTSHFTHNEDESKIIVKNVLNNLKITKGNIDEIERVDGRTLIDCYVSTAKEHGSKGIPYFGPTPNEDYRGNPLTYGFSDEAKKAPMIIGTNFSEFLSLPNIYDRNSMSEEEMVSAIENKFGVEKATELIRLFHESFPHHKTIDILTYDCCCIRPDSYEFCLARAAADCAPTYNYLFTPVFKLNDGTTASHSTDIAFVFNNAEMLPSTDLDGRELSLQHEIAGRLVALAKTGNPQLDGQAVWHPVSKTDVPTMIFDRVTEERVNFDKELMEKLGQIVQFELVIG